MSCDYIPNNATREHRVKCWHINAETFIRSAALVQNLGQNAPMNRPRPLARSEVPRNWAIKPNHHRGHRPSTSLRQSCFEYAHAPHRHTPEETDRPSRASYLRPCCDYGCVGGRSGREKKGGGMFHPNERERREVITLIAHFARKLSSLASFVLWLVCRLCPFRCVRRAPLRFGRGESQ